MTHKIVVDERAMLTIVDEMRIRIPEEIREARRVMRQRDQIQPRWRLSASLGRRRSRPNR